MDWPNASDRAPAPRVRDAGYEGSLTGGQKLLALRFFCPAWEGVFDETDVSPVKQEAPAQARLSQAYGHGQRPEGPQPAAPEGAKTPDGIRPDRPKAVRSRTGCHAQGS